MDLSDASVLVVGASGGLGSALCRGLAERGARLTLMARDADRLSALDVDGTIAAGDITVAADCEHAVDAAIEAHGRLDGVIGAAGVVAFGPLLELDDDVLDQLVAVNLVGPLRLARAAIARMEDGGFIANVSAVVAENPVAGMAAYSAAKAALTSLDVSLGRELRKRRITVLDARPPHTETGLADRPIAGERPKLPEGLDPAVVARRILESIEAGDRELASSDFG